MLSDTQIIELYFARDEMAIEETSQKYGRLCFNIANNILHSPQDADECVNDTYMGVWNAIPPKKPVNLRNYISMITRRLSLKKFEYNNARKRSHEFEVSLSEMESVLPDDNIRNDISDQNLGEIISRFLDTLDQDSKVIFIKKYWYFDTISDIAIRYGFTESKVKMSLSRTRNKLKNYLDAKGVRI